MRNAAGVALTTSAAFLLIVAILLGSAALFYMSTSIIVTLAASRLQAWLSVRGLHFDRVAPDKTQVGELSTVEITVWSDRRINRPLVVVQDRLPSKMVVDGRTASLPIAPAYDVPIRSQYKFRPMRRGKYRWSGITVIGTDALGLVRTEKTYDIKPSEMLVVPSPIALDIDLPPAPGWGFAESEHGQGRGSGIEPRGIREYTSGDSLRYIHWRSSARAGKLLVKEFATGSHAAIGFMFQRTRGTEVGFGASTTLEQMCANAAYVSEKLLRQGAEIIFPGLNFRASSSGGPAEVQQEVLATLAQIEADSSTPISADLQDARGEMGSGGLLYLFISVADDLLPKQIRDCVNSGIQVMVLAYDPQPFMPPKQRWKGPNAADDKFCEQMRNAGAIVVVVPKAKHYETAA